MNCIAILSVALSSVTNVYVLLIGTLVARAAELLFMVPFAKRKGFRFQTVFDLKDDNLHQMIHIAVPVIIGTSADQINVLVDRTLASEIAGGISALNYASRLAGFVQGLFVLSISSVMYPMISKMASEHNMKGPERLFIRGHRVDKSHGCSDHHWCRHICRTYCHISVWPWRLHIWRQ